MPLRDYQCTECDKIYQDVLEKRDEKMLSCEDCGGLVERIMSLTNFQLKGDNWYKKDLYGLKKPSKETYS
jgi:putative FmdB family regulatory protein